MTRVGITNGTCWDDSEHFSSEEVAQIAQCTLESFARHYDSQFMWTARNQIESRWSYIQAWDEGWIRKSASEESLIIQ